jgi:hypothetical protein
MPLKPNCISESSILAATRAAVCGGVRTTAPVLMHTYFQSRSYACSYRPRYYVQSKADHISAVYDGAYCQSGFTTSWTAACVWNIILSRRQRKVALDGAFILGLATFNIYANSWPSTMLNAHLFVMIYLSMAQFRAFISGLYGMYGRTLPISGVVRSTVSML